MRRDGSWRNRLRATCRNATIFSAAWSFRMRQRSSLNVTSNDQWSLFSISQCWRIIQAADGAPCVAVQAIVERGEHRLVEPTRLCQVLRDLLAAPILLR